MGQYMRALVPMTFAQKLPLDAYADSFGGVRGLKFGLSQHLYQNVVYVCRKTSGESVHLHTNA